MCRFVLLLTLVGVLLLPPPARAQAPAPPVRLLAEQALLIEHGERVELIVSLTVAVDAPAVVLVPVPGASIVTAFADGAQLFTSLAAVTQPLTQVEPRYVLGLSPVNPPTAIVAPTDAPPLAPQSFAFATYTAGERAPLAAWGAERLLLLTATEEAQLAEHTAAGGGLVALMLDADIQGALPALQIVYPAETATYARPLGAAATPALDLFVLAAGRRTATDTATHYAGPLEEIAALPPVGQQQLAFPGYLTHLHQPASSPALAVTLQAAPSDIPFQRTQVVQEDIYLLQRSSTAIGLGLVACTSLLALVGAVAMRRRLDAINPDP
jgi:hypothetical protein